MRTARQNILPYLFYLSLQASNLKNSKKNDENRESLRPGVWFCLCFLALRRLRSLSYACAQNTVLNMSQYDMPEEGMYQQLHKQEQTFWAVLLRV